MEEKNIDREALLKIEAQSKKIRKKLLLILGGIVLLTGILCAAILIIDSKSNGDRIPQETLYEYKDSDFYEPYTGNIMENEEYLDLDRKVYYADGSGMEISIEDDSLSEFSNEVIFLYNYLQTIIAGDHDAYNACFNDTYFASNAPMGRFNPQMVYRSKITYHSRGNDQNGVWVRYKVEYMIHRNDGSFRRDMLSDASLPQYITLRINPEILIESLISHKEIVTNPTE